MSKKKKYLVAHNAFELVEILGLDPEDAVEIDFRVRLSIKIAEVVKKRNLTHSEVAALAKASRTRITAILNGNTAGISTDLMLRILYSLGYRVKTTFTAVKIAA